MRLRMAKPVHPNTPEWDALELAHMKFNIDVEYQETNVLAYGWEPWRFRGKSKGMKFNATYIYRRLEIEH